MSSNPNYQNNLFSKFHQNFDSRPDFFFDLSSSVVFEKSQVCSIPPPFSSFLPSPPLLPGRNIGISRANNFFSKRSKIAPLIKEEGGGADSSLRCGERGRERREREERGNPKSKTKKNLRCHTAHLNAV